MEPLIDVVIPVHDNLPWLRMCLTALHAFTAHPYRVIVVNNASQKEETTNWLKGAPDCDKIPPHGRVSVVWRNVNDSFSASVNAGVRVGCSPYVVILNSDAIVTEGWDKALLTDLAHKDVGLAGASTNAAAGLQASTSPAAARLAAQNDPSNGAMHAGPSAGVPDRVSAPFLIFFAVGLRREVWDEVGELDGGTCRGWGGGEDLDYSWRVIDKGYRCVVSSAFVLHGCSKTYAQEGFTAEAKGSAETANLERLRTKHGDARVRRGLKTQPKVMIAPFSRTNMNLGGFVESMISAVSYLATHGWHMGFTWPRRTMIDQAREEVARAVIEAGTKSVTGGGVDFDYLVMLDDDHTFPPDAIWRLVASGKDVIGALAYRRMTHADPRQADHTSCVFRWGDPNDPEDGVMSVDGLEHTGLHRVDAIGFGMVAIKVEVLRGLQRAIKAKDLVITRDPTKYDNAERVSRMFDFAKLGEDIGFCAKASRLGYEVWLDTDLILGHLGDPVNVDEAYVRRWRAQVGGQA